MNHIGAFEDDNLLALTQFPSQFAVGGVDAVNLRRSTLQQAVGEPAGGTAQVCSDHRGNVEVEVVQCMVKFQACS